MKLVELCLGKNVYIATKSSEASIVRQEKHVATFRKFVSTMTYEEHKVGMLGQTHNKELGYNVATFINFFAPRFTTTQK